MPRHTLTRTVTIELVEHDGKRHIVPNCDCRCINRESQTCRHVKHMMKDIPTLQSFQPRCFKSYNQLMHKNQKYTEIVEKYESTCNEVGGMIFDATSCDK